MFVQKVQNATAAFDALTTACQVIAGTTGKRCSASTVLSDNAVLDETNKIAKFRGMNSPNIAAGGTMLNLFQAYITKSYPNLTAAGEMMIVVIILTNPA